MTALDCDGADRRDDNDADMGGPVALGNVRHRGTPFARYRTVLTWTHGEALPVWQNPVHMWGLGTGENPDYTETEVFVGAYTGDIAG